MKLLKKFKIILVAITIYYIYCNHLLSSDYKDIINKVFSDRKLDNLEGIWVKTIANQGPPGCVTMFYKDQDKYFQIHIDECFVIGKITGRQKKTSSNFYEGENAVYFYNGDVNWGPSSIKISENLNSFSITHGSYNNIFREEWKRIWPKDISNYNLQQNID